MLCLIGVGVGAFGTLIGAGVGFILTPILLLLYPHESAQTLTPFAAFVTDPCRATASMTRSRLFDADLNLIGRSDNHVGDVSGFAPPGDIHRVHNTADTIAISIHIYGTDVTRIGSSVRRYYD